MPLLSCRLIAHSVGPHIQQIYTGFAMLHQRSLVDVTQVTRKERRIDPAKPPHLRGARHAHLRVVLNGHLRIHYDTHDSWEVDEEFLDESDYLECVRAHPVCVATTGLYGLIGWKFAEYVALSHAADVRCSGAAAGRRSEPQDTHDDGNRPVLWLTCDRTRWS